MMTEGMGSKNSKAIQTILMKKKDELFELINNGASIEELDAVVQKCLDEAEKTGNTSVPEARMIFNNCKKRRYTTYLETLITYLIGVSAYH